MKFNPVTKRLLTNDGDLIKILHCPLGVDWQNLNKVSSYQRYCEFCDKNIIDIRHLDDKAVMTLVAQDPSVCLKLDINDPNIRVVHHDL